MSDKGGPSIHWCAVKGCPEWGSRGHAGPGGTVWLCWEHDVARREAMAAATARGPAATNAGTDATKAAGQGRLL